MGNSQFKAGYDFQHIIKDNFLELGFIAQEEQWETRTDIVLSRPPLEIAVECKYYTEGVIPEHVETFDQRLKLWQKMDRPCLGVIVGTSFQPEAKLLCEQKNIAFITRQSMENALVRKRLAQPIASINISKRIDDLLKSLAGLFRNWLDLLFGDPVKSNQIYLLNLAEHGYITELRELSTNILEYSITKEGEIFISSCRRVYKLLRSTESAYYMSKEQITLCIQSVLQEWSESLYEPYEIMMLMGLGLLEYSNDGLKVSEFGNNLLEVMTDS
jgi:hypothetical protein